MKEPKSPSAIIQLEKKLIEERKQKLYTQPKKTETKPKPESTENSVPPKHEPTPQESKTQQQIDKQLPTVSYASTQRPQQPSKTREQGSVIVAKALAEQLATSPEMKARLLNDELKLAVLDYPTMVALGHFSRRYVHDGIGYYGHISNWILRGTQGIGGRTRNDIIKALGVTSGIQSVEVAKKPNIVARSLWRRDWKSKAESEGKEVVES